MHTISNSSWASLKERGEDYSVWLTNLKRVHESDSVLVSIVVEILTPSFFTRGNFVDNGLVSGASALQMSELSGVNLGKLVKGLSGSFKREPSPVELMESLYLGNQALQAMEEMIKN